MSHDFPSRVRELAGLADEGDARRVATAVLGALAAHLTGSAARALANGLPEPFVQPLTQTGETAEPGGMDEFYAAVSERSGLHDAAGAVGAVLRALAEYADRDAVEAAREQLPAELRGLMQPDPRENRIPAG